MRNNPHIVKTFGPWFDSLSKQGVLSRENAELWHAAKKAKTIQELLYLEVLRKLDQIFYRHQVNILILKGLALAYRYYDNPLHRPYSDIDLLVQKEDWQKAQDAMKEVEAEIVPQISWKGNSFKLLYNLNGVPVELHSLFIVDRIADFSLKNLTRPTSILGIGWIKELSPELSFVYLCGHGAFQHLYDELHWLIDLDLMIRKEKNLDWQKILEYAENFCLMRAVGVSLAILKKNFNSPIPQWVQNEKLGNRWLNKYLPIYLSPQRILNQKTQRPRFLYLILKALMRDSLTESFVYGVKRIFQWN